MGVVSIDQAWPAAGQPFTNAKKAAYQGFGVESSWIVLPDLGKPELIAFELRRGQYEQVAQVSGDEVFAAVRPFPVEVVPSRLVAGLR
jgi:hypothetical protein